METKLTYQRKSFVKHNDDNAITLLKPMSGEHEGEILTIYEDAYGNLQTGFLRKEEIYRQYDISIQEIDEFLNQL